MTVRRMSTDGKVVRPAENWPSEWEGPGVKLHDEDIAYYVKILYDVTICMVLVLVLVKWLC